MKEYVCIVCPASCRLQVEERDGGIAVSGNVCKRGLDYGVQEYTDPKRMLTTTVAIEGGVLPRIPVISDGETPKAKLRDCLAQLYALKLHAPVNAGDVVARNICGTGVDVVASRSMKRK
jgi:CxxC motif-containing protein